ncbi:hypothetical protein KM043_006716 [Ampulex compressa]|nr:hypothetical protein KM043_006716 [Ampulex compressa]
MDKIEFPRQPQLQPSRIAFDARPGTCVIRLILSDWLGERNRKRCLSFRARWPMLGGHVDLAGFGFDLPCGRNRTCDRADDRLPLDPCDNARDRKYSPVSIMNDIQSLKSIRPYFYPVDHHGEPAKFEP